MLTPYFFEEPKKLHKRALRTSYKEVTMAIYYSFSQVNNKIFYYKKDNLS